MMVMVCDAAIFCCSSGLTSLIGMLISIVLGLLKVVVSIKKVSNRNARSTIGVMSICVEAFLAFTLLCFPPLLPLSWVCTSDILLLCFQVGDQIEFVHFVIL